MLRVYKDNKRVCIYCTETEQVSTLCGYGMPYLIKCIDSGEYGWFDKKEHLDARDKFFEWNNIAEYKNFEILRVEFPKEFPELMI